MEQAAVAAGSEPDNAAPVISAGLSASFGYPSIAQMARYILWMPGPVPDLTPPPVPYISHASPAELIDISQDMW